MGWTRCGHEVCEVRCSKHCLIGSGEVLDEYSDVGGDVCWIVLPDGRGGRKHVVLSCAMGYRLKKSEELVRSFFRGLERDRTAGDGDVGISRMGRTDLKVRRVMFGTRSV